MNALKAIFQNQLTEAPKTKREKQQTGYGSHLGWTFLAEHANDRPKAVRTYQTLFSVSKDYTYFTPNTFCHNKKRSQANLRWINTFSLDLDVKGQKFNHIPLHDLVFYIVSKGLPEPSLVVKTPSGGLHVHWYLEDPRRAYKKEMIDHYKRILKVIIEELSCYGADPLANGPERYFRIPTEENTIYQTSKRVPFKVFADWYSEQVTKRQAAQKKAKLAANLKPGQVLLQHAAVQTLLKGVSEGNRDSSCYTLALAFKASGFDEEEAEKRLHEWNTKNEPPMRQIDVKRKVKSAFKAGSPAGPSSEWISRLSGMPFSYQVWEEAKPRHERVYSHLSEWEDDILAYIRQRKGSKVTSSQRELCEEITSSANRKQKISYSTFKRAMASLIEAGKLVKEVIGKGRGAVTTFTIQEKVKPLKTPPETPKKVEKKSLVINGANSNTPVVPVVGGAAFPMAQPEVVSFPSTPLPAILTTSPFLPAPVPGNVPARFVSALFNRGFTDGRFVFAAWGRVQLAFKSFNLPFSVIASNQDYMNLVIEAVSLTVGKKGAPTVGGYLGQDAFMKYLYGTVKGMLSTYREEELEQFVSEIEGLSLIELLSIGCDLEEELRVNPFADRELILEKLRELESEESALKRREAVRKMKAKGQSLFFNFDPFEDD